MHVRVRWDPELLERGDAYTVYLRDAAAVRMRNYERYSSRPVRMTWLDAPVPAGTMRADKPRIPSSSTDNGGPRPRTTRFI